MDKHPSYVEFRGLYNVDPKAFPLEDNSTEIEKVHLSEPRVPPLSSKELKEIDRVTYECLRDRALLLGIREKDVEFELRYAISDQFNDRTLQIELPNPRYLNQNLVIALQAVVASRPLWRILIQNGDIHNRDEKILIYPDKVYLGSHDVTNKLDDEIASAAAREQARIEPRVGPHRRQLEFLNNEIKNHIPLPPNSFCLLGIFDNYCGDFNRISLWFLHNGKHKSIVRLLTPHSKTVGDQIKTFADGTFFSPCEMDLECAYWIAQWTIATEEVSEPIMVEDGMNGTTTVINIDPLQIVTDSSLGQK
jgi:hypothetical protein